MQTTSSNPGTGGDREGPSPLETKAASRGRRRWIFLLAVPPVLALFGLLLWGTVRSGGRPGGVFVNNNFGEVPVSSRAAPGFSIETFGGDQLSLADLRGKIVLVDFWASWCPPCRREAPVLAAAYAAYKSQPVEFVGIDIWDNERDARAYIQRYGIGYPNGLDPGGLITIDYGVTGIPEKFLIDREGRLSRKFVGPMEWQQLVDALDEMLAE